MQNAEIKAEVESWLLDLPNGATQRIQGWVNEAIREACKRYNFRQMEAGVASTHQQAIDGDRRSVLRERLSFDYFTKCLCSIMGMAPSARSHAACTQPTFARGSSK